MEKFKIKDGFILRSVAGEHVVVPIGEHVVDFTAMITLNETGAFVWKVLQDGASKKEVVQAVLNEYDVEEEIASKDVENLIEKLREADLLDG